MRPRVAQDPRCNGSGGEALRRAWSTAGQVRLPPALTLREGCPQPPQKGFRAFQSRRERAWAYIAAFTKHQHFLSKELLGVSGGAYLQKQAAKAPSFPPET